MKRLGRYEVQERIGHGAMADVYRAYDPNIDRVLAIKVLKEEFRQNREYASRFLREAKAAGALSHPNIVTIYDVGEVDGHPYIAMELLEGAPLDQTIRLGARLPAETVVAIGLQLADALRYAHAQSVIHRDIKPSNIMLAPDGRSLKILDFGIARLAEAEGQDDTLRTQVGQVVGTPRYMSPEQALGLPLDGRSDLFSVGVLLYELITGARAFGGSSAATLALQITQQDPAPVLEAAPDCPRGLAFIIEKLLAKKPERRFANGEQLADAFRREQLAYGAESPASGRRLSLQVRLALVSAAILAVVLLVSVGVVLNRQYRAMEQMTLTSGSAIASFVAANAALQAADNAALPPEQRDWAPTEAFVKAASRDPNVKAMTVIDAGGIIRAASDPRRIGARYAGFPSQPAVRRTADLSIYDAATADGHGGFRFVRPITYGGAAFGAVDVVLGKAELEAAAALSRLLMLGLGLVTLGAAAAVSYMSGRRLAGPVRRLRKAMADAANGDLDFRISHKRKDELGELLDGFNALTASVQARLEAAEARRPAAAGDGAPAAASTRFDDLVARLEKARLLAPDGGEADSLAGDATIVPAPMSARR